MAAVAVRDRLGVVSAYIALVKIICQITAITLDSGALHLMVAKLCVADILFVIAPHTCLAHISHLTAIAGNVLFLIFMSQRIGVIRFLKYFAAS